MSNGGVGLSFEEADKLLSYDQVTGKLSWKVARKKCSVGDVAGSYSDPRGYVAVKINYRRYWAHRVCWLLAKGNWPAHQIDHINRDKSDNRLTNLRECTPSENLQNLPRKANNTSGHTGVSFHKQSGKWRAIIVAKGKRFDIGSFATREQAISARIAAKVQHHPFNPNGL